MLAPKRWFWCLTLVVAPLIPLLPGAPIAEVLKLLPDGQPLVDPSQVLTAERFHASGDSGQCELRTEQGQPILNVHVTRKPENRWEVGTNATTVSAIAKGDLLLLAFEARAVDKDGTGEINAVFRRREKPYHHALSEPCKFGSAWKAFALPFSPAVAMEAGGALLIFNFGARTQHVELRDVRLLSFGKRVEYLSLMRTLGLKPTGKRRAVGETLKPDLLWQIGAYDAFAEQPHFDPNADWTHTYAIWTCHGYLFAANKVVGTLKLARTRHLDQAPGAFTLNTELRIAGDAGGTQTTAATIQCRADPVASPMSWSLNHEFTHSDGTVQDTLATHESGRAEDKHVIRSQNGVDTRTPVAVQITSDWCLFEAVQRLPFDPSTPIKFNLWEGLSLPKGEHELSYAGRHTFQIDNHERNLHRFIQTGPGILPYEYWLTDANELILVVTHSRAYILVADAEQRLDAHVKSRIAAYERDRDRQRRKENKPQ